MKKILYTGLQITGLIGVGIFLGHVQPSIILAICIAIIPLTLMLLWPEFNTLIVIFMTYINLPSIAYQFHGVPKIFAASISLLLCLPLIYYIIVKRQKLIIDQTFLLMLGFFAWLFVSLLYAKSMTIATGRIIEFLFEGILPYFLIVNAIRSPATLRRVIWVLLLAGSLLGALSLYQEVTGSYNEKFGGLAQRNTENWETEIAYQEAETKYKMAEEHAGYNAAGTRPRVQLSNRAGGPTDGPNHYGQIMLVLLPLALFRFWGERSKLLRISAAAAAIFILSAILLSYSRGAFLALGLLLLIMTFMGYIRPYQILTLMFMILLMIAVVAPHYFVRMQTILNAEALVSEEKSDTQADGAIRGRLTEMLSALMVFLDHPILGVGPGQYTPFYSMEYQLNPDIAFKQITVPRRAHMLYFELAAETGIIGFAIFMTIVLLILSRLWHMRRYWVNRRPDLANVATAFCLSIIAHLSTAIFLSFAYQRYYWLLLALSGATLQIFRSEISSTDGYEESSPESLYVESLSR